MTGQPEASRLTIEGFSDEFAGLKDSTKKKWRPPQSRRVAAENTGHGQRVSWLSDESDAAARFLTATGPGWRWLPAPYISLHRYSATRPSTLHCDTGLADTSVTVVFPTWFRTSLALRRAVTTLTLLAAGTRPIDAQIYSWVDASGSLVVSNVPPGTNLGLRSYEVPESDGIRATRAVEPKRSRSFDAVIEAHASRSGVRAGLVRAVIQVESAFNPRAVSRKGAMGLMQLMPATARQFGVADAFDPSENVRAGVAYLRQLLDRYGGNERLALAAYNAGPGAVDRFGQSVPPFAETRDYVKRIGGLAGTEASASTVSASIASAPQLRIFRQVEVIDGHEVVRYTDQAPSSR